MRGNDKYEKTPRQAWGLNEMKKDVVVIGLGNVLMSDEGIGCAIAGVLSARRQEYPNVEFIDAGSGGMKLLHIISGRKKAIIVDCALMGTEPGTIKRFVPEDVQSVKKLSHYSLHEVDVLKIIEMSGKLGQSPDEVVIFGIEPQRIEPGRKLGETLSQRLPEYAATIEKELRD